MLPTGECNIVSPYSRYTRHSASTCFSPIFTNITIQAADLLDVLRRSEPDRKAAASRRRQRLKNFRMLQDQLLQPPALGNPPGIGFRTRDDEGKRLKEEASDKNKWYLEDDRDQRERAQRAHFLAATAADGVGKKVYSDEAANM